MRTSQNGIDLIKKFEGCRLAAYKCPAGVWTIGYGHTEGVSEGQKISQEQAEKYLVEDLVKYEKYVEKYVDLELNQNQFDALVSFTYNCGAGNLKKLVKNRNHNQIAEAFQYYRKANGKILNGLVKRRAEEKALFLTSSDTNHPVLKHGAKGNSVIVLQKLLNKAGYELKEDGRFGPKTLEAVMAYQAEHGLVVDGKVGPKTWTELLA